MDKKYGKKGLKIIAPECQRSPTDSIMSLVEENKMAFTITNGIRGPNLSNGIPHMAVFDTGGKLVWTGHPMSEDAEDAIKDALKSATADAPEKQSGLAPRKFLVEERTWTNAEGRQMVASVVSLVGNTAKFRFKNGQTFDYDISKLAAEDQKVIKEAAGSESE